MTYQRQGNFTKEVYFVRSRETWKSRPHGLGSAWDLWQEAGNIHISELKIGESLVGKVQVLMLIQSHENFLAETSVAFLRKHPKHLKKSC